MKTISNKESQALTARQLQVVALVGQGFSNKEIANDLKISEGTVKQHIFTIFRLLNVSSRAKLAVVSQKLGTIAKSKPLKKALNNSNSLGYSWRLIVAVAIAIPEVDNLNAAEIIQRKKYLDQFRNSIDELVFALDASSMPLPDGGMLIWFGHPTAHIDDADRAALLVQSISMHLIGEQGKRLRVGLGISTQAEIVPAETTQLTSAKAFQQAISLAKKSSQLTLSLANTLTQQLCCASIPWLELRPSHAGSKDTTEKAKESIYAIHYGTQKTSSAISSWGEFTFLTPAFKSAQSGVSQWLCVESWPPSLANSLIDAVSQEAIRAGFFPVKLYIPSTKRRDLLLGSLLTQVEIESAQFDLSSNQPGSTLDRLLSSLWKISSKVPVVLQVSGIQSLQALKTALGDRGIDRLVGLRVLVVVTNLCDVKKPQTSISVLGPRPDNGVFTRRHVMEEPKPKIVPEGVLIDMQAMVDDLSPAARQMVFAAAAKPHEAFNELIPSVDLPRPVLQGALQELTNLGLIYPRDDHYFDFRDAITASAIAQLNQLAINA
jgi:DNA-binding CsgD family transcriptional regulator